MIEDRRTILVVSRFRLTGDGLRQALAARNVGHEVSYAPCFRVRDAEAPIPDVVIMACGIDPCGCRLADSVEALPGAKHIVICRAPDAEQQMRWLAEGAHGIIDETRDDVTPGLLDTVIRSVCAGNLWARQKTVSQLMARARAEVGARSGLRGGMRRLTSREEELLGHLSDGLSNRQIAGRLYISEKTVKGHLTNIYRKLKVRNRLQATLKASTFRRNSLASR